MSLEDEIEEKPQLSIQEEYKLWRKNCPLMYEFVSETALTWPSLTVQWLPEVTRSDTAAIGQRLLLGTHTSGEDTNYLKVAATSLPQWLLPGSNSPGLDSVPEETPEERQERLRAEVTAARLRVVKKLKASAEINRARYQPQDPSRVATIDGSGLVSIYNLADTRKAYSRLQLKHHTENGYGLAWSPVHSGWLLSAADDCTTALWDAAAGSASGTTKPLSVLRNHTAAVNDIQWQQLQGNSHLFGSVSDDCTIALFDSRALTSSKPLNTIRRRAAINTIAFSPLAYNLFAVGLEDASIELFDIRRPDVRLHAIVGHSEAITALSWDPHHDGVLASGSQDRRAILWDLSKIGEEQSLEDEDDGAAELLMMHAGHTSAITDLAFNPVVPWTLASTADDNIVQLWTLASKITAREEEEDDILDVYDLE